MGCVTLNLPPASLVRPQIPIAASRTFRLLVDTGRQHEKFGIQLTLHHPFSLQLLFPLHQMLWQAFPIKFIVLSLFLRVSRLN